MHKRNLLPAILLALLAAALTFGAVSAHGHIPVGQYELVVGWVTEPPVVGQVNAITIAIKDTTAPDKEVDASKMTAVMAYGGQTKILNLIKSPGVKNQYEAHLIPSVAGQYTLQLRGKIDTTEVDVDTQPEEVTAIETLAFPATAQAQPTAIRIFDWLSIGALVISLVALVLALRKPRS